MRSQNTITKNLQVRDKDFGGKSSGHRLGTSRLTPNSALHPMYTDAENAYMASKRPKQAIPHRKQIDLNSASHSVFIDKRHEKSTTMSSSSQLRHKKVTNSFAAEAPISIKKNKDFQSPRQVPVRERIGQAYPSNETPQVENDLTGETISTKHFVTNKTAEQLQDKEQGRNYEDLSQSLLQNQSIESKNQGAIATNSVMIAQ